MHVHTQHCIVISDCHSPGCTASDHSSISFRFFFFHSPRRTSYQMATTCCVYKRQCLLSLQLSAAIYCQCTCGCDTLSYRIMKHTVSTRFRSDLTTLSLLVITSFRSVQREPCLALDKQTLGIRPIDLSTYRPYLGATLPVRTTVWFDKRLLVESGSLHVALSPLLVHYKSVAIVTVAVTVHTPCQGPVWSNLTIVRCCRCSRHDCHGDWPLDLI